ncbi:uncharacterized protein LOC112572630 [Pomacea canaliculata]|uniref:uncharacterized protein LOC112572630 n=1 Tax=Pomacea canaliculata TaxID=400727 RepID=UPI000D73E794|nr:uncharacterized protein LOC112572630 [Pomacea canaliculata]XP_025108178.1 uncharacterized protein LOC112572630 [Pomacea canaliculata]
MALKGGGVYPGVRRWLWLGLMVTSASSAATGSKCTCPDRDYEKKDFLPSLPNTQNVALGKPAKASSLLNSTRHKAVSGPACLAVDGNRNTVFTPCNRYPNGPNCIHTAEDDREPYWEVDLGEVYSIANITVYWRKIGKNVGVNVTVDGKLCHTFKDPVLNPSTITCNKPLAGRTVKLSKSDNISKDDYYLIVCEVEVWARTTFSPSTFDATSSAPLTFEVTSLAPQTSVVTRMAVIMAGTFLCGCVVTGLCAALVWWLRRVKGRQRERNASSQGGDVIMTETNEPFQALPDAADSSGLTEGAAGYGGGPDYDDESPEYINTSMDQSLEDLAFKQKGNVYKPFPTLWSQHKVATDPDSSSSDNEEYVEVI